MRRSRLVLVALLLAIGVSGVWWGPWVWLMVRYRAEVTVNLESDRLGTVKVATVKRGAGAEAEMKKP